MSNITEDEISLYLLNRLLPEDRAAFKKHMQNNPEFKREVLLQKEIAKALQYKRSAEAKATIQDLVLEWEQHVPELNKSNLKQVTKQGLENLSETFNTLVFQFFNPYSAAFRNPVIEQLSNEDQAFYHYNRNDYVKAIPFLLKLPGDDYEVQLMIGNAYVAQQNYETAYPYFKKLIDEEAVFFLSDAHWYASLCLTGLNQIEPAKKHFLYLINNENTNKETRQNAQVLLNKISQQL